MPSHQGLRLTIADSCFARISDSNLAQNSAGGLSAFFRRIRSSIVIFRSVSRFISVSKVGVRIEATVLRNAGGNAPFRLSIPSLQRSPGGPGRLFQIKSPLSYD